MALLPISASSRARTILTFLLDELKVVSIKRSLAGMTLRIPEQVPMSNKSSWLLKQRVCGTNKGSLNQLTQCVLTSSWPRRKTTSGSNHKKLLQQIVEGTETKIHPDGPKSLQVLQGWAAIPELRVVQAAPKAICTSLLLKVIFPVIFESLLPNLSVKFET